MTKIIFLYVDQSLEYSLSIPEYANTKALQADGPLAHRLHRARHIAPTEPVLELAQPTVALPGIVVQRDAVQGGRKLGGHPNPQAGQPVAVQLQPLQSLKALEGARLNGGNLAARQV